MAIAAEVDRLEARVRTLEKKEAEMREHVINMTNMLISVVEFAEAKVAMDAEDASKEEVD